MVVVCVVVAGMEVVGAGIDVVFGFNGDVCGLMTALVSRLGH